MLNFSRIKNFNPFFILFVIVLCITGAVSVYSTTFYPDRIASPLFWQQIIFYLAGFLLFFLISIFDVSYLAGRNFILALFLLTVTLLLLVTIVGVSAGEAQRWIAIGDRFTIQPSEFAKLSVVFIIAFCFGYVPKYHNKTVIFSNFAQVVKTLLGNKKFLGVLGILIIIFLIFIQKSLGNTILVALISMATIAIAIKINLLIILLLVGFVAGIALTLGLNAIFIIFLLAIVALFFKNNGGKLIIFVLVVISAIAIGSLGSWSYGNLLSDYQRSRITGFLDIGDNTSLTTNWNKTQAIMAAGSGQLLGEGFLAGDIVKNNLLPFAYTDFAFAAFAEQFGFIGVLFLLLLYGIIFLLLLNVSKNARTTFEKLLITGILWAFFLNMFQHMAMNIGITPITGVPLPLITYGGSSVLTYLAALGIVHSVYINTLEKEENVERIMI